MNVSRFLWIDNQRIEEHGARDNKQALTPETHQILQFYSNTSHCTIQQSPYFQFTTLHCTRAQKNGEDGEESSRTKPNLTDSLVPKQRIKQTDRHYDTDKQKIDRKTHRQTDIQVVRQVDRQMYR